MGQQLIDKHFRKTKINILCYYVRSTMHKTTHYAESKPTIQCYKIESLLWPLEGRLPVLLDPLEIADRCCYCYELRTILKDIQLDRC